MDTIHMRITLYYKYMYTTGIIFITEKKRKQGEKEEKKDPKRKIVELKYYKHNLLSTFTRYRTRFPKNYTV